MADAVEDAVEKVSELSVDPSAADAPMIWRESRRKKRKMRSASRKKKIRRKLLAHQILIRIRIFPSWMMIWTERCVGPVEWLRPYTDETIAELGQKGIKSLLVVPISFVSEHIETLEEIDVEYKELAMKSGVIDLANAVIESLPYVGAMAVSNLEARQSLVPLGSVEELLAAYDTKREKLPPPVLVWEWGWTRSAETWNGRAAMIAVLGLLVLEVTTGQGFLHQWCILPLFH